MDCPICHHDETKVARSTATGTEVRRVRRCGRCGHEWPTVELATKAIEHEREVVAKARELAQVVGEG